MEAFACTACGAAMRAEDLDRRLAIITCVQCGRVYDLTRAADRTRVGAAGIESRPLAAAPNDLAVTVEGDRFTVSWRWANRMSGSELSFGVFSCVVLAIIGSVFHLLGMFEQLFVVGVYAILATSGLGMIVRGLVMSLNRTHISVDGKHLEVTHGPMPSSRPTAKLAVGTIEQLYVSRHESVAGKSAGYALYAVSVGNEDTLLADHIATIGPAVYLEQALEQRLGLRDRPVAGEDG